MAIVTQRRAGCAAVWLAVSLLAGPALAQAAAGSLADAVKANDERQVAALLMQGVSAAGDPTPDGITPLHLAAGLNEHALVALLIGYGADPHARSARGSTPLHWAAARDAAEAAATLLDFGADPACRNANGLKPAAWAEQRRAVRVMQVLARHEADVRRRAEAARAAARSSTLSGGRAISASARPYLGALRYLGHTERTHATVAEVDATLRLKQTGYVEVSVVDTDIATRPDAVGFHQREFKGGGGWYVTPTWLLRGRGGYLDGVLSGGSGSGWIAGAGIDWLRDLQLVPALEGFYADYPDASVAYVTPRLTWNAHGWSLVTALYSERVDETDGGASLYATLRQDLTLHLSAVSDLVLGYSGGRSPYSLRGFGDVLFNQPDLQRYSAHVGLLHHRAPFSLSLDTALTGFESVDGQAYQSVAQVVSLGYDLPGGLASSGSAARVPWSIEGGVDFRPLAVDLHSAAPQPLIAPGDVVAPVTFMDDTRTFAAEYAYTLRTRETEGYVAHRESGAAAPFVSVRRACGPVAGGTAVAGLRYGAASVAAETGWEPHAEQTVYESITTSVEPSPLGLVSQGQVVSRETHAYASYTGSTRTSVSADVFELGPFLGWRRRVTDWLSLALEAGPAMALVDWQVFEETQWLEDGDSTVLTYASRECSDLAAQLGAEGRASLVLAPAGDAISLSCFGGYAWFDALNAADQDLSLRVDLNGYSAGIGLGIALP